MLRTRKALPLILLTAAFACAQDPAPVVVGGSHAERVTQEPVATTDAALRVTYLGNEGFLIESGAQRVLIDALFGQGISGYEVVPSHLREALESGSEPWDGVAVALASHFHRDHFDPLAVGRFLEANPEALFISTPQAAASFGDANPGRPDLQSRFRAILPAPGRVETVQLGDLKIEVLNLHHGAGNPPTQNLGLVISLGGERALHFGDTEAKMIDFEPYLDLLKDTDIALLPFWFLSSEWRADMVSELIQPRRIAVGHLPTRDAPAGYFARWNSYDELRSKIEDRFPEAWIADQSAEVMP